MVVDGLARAAHSKYTSSPGPIRPVSSIRFPNRNSTIGGSWKNKHNNTENNGIV